MSTSNFHSANLSSGTRCQCFPISNTGISKRTVRSYKFSKEQSLSIRRRRALKMCSSPKESEKAKVIIITGPTGVGKTRLALHLAKKLNGEIISADSVQVYKGLDVGSAKTPIEEREGIPHHLIDILHPSEEYSVGKYYRDARKATNEIIDRGHVPIVVGGSGLYLRWYIYGKPEVPATTPEISGLVDIQLGKLEEKGDWDTAVQMVLKEGDSSVLSLTKNDWYRLRRSLEIIKVAGVPKTNFSLPYHILKDKIAPDYTVVSTNQKAERDSVRDLDYNFFCFFLSMKRTELYRTIDQRCEEMIIAPNGLLAEASWLIDMGLLPNMTSVSRAIGYQQAMDFLLTCREAGGFCSEAEFLAFLSKFQTASRNYAKRQYIWSRNEPLYRRLDASQSLDILIDTVLMLYHHSSDASIKQSLFSCKAGDETDHKSLKHYRTRNRYFVSPADCTSVLEWIMSTQCQKNQISLHSSVFLQHHEFKHLS